MTSGQGAFLVLPSARQDLREIAAFLGQRNSANAAQFLKKAHGTMVQLADAPFLGSSRPQADSRLHSIRRWPVKDFPQYGIFYRPFASGNGIEVFAVLHERQNIGEQLEAALEP